MLETKENAVVLLSGGLDSTVLTYQLTKLYNVYPIVFDYGQRHAREINCAMLTCQKLGLVPKLVNLVALNQVSESALTRRNIAVPENVAYDDEQQSVTVVPNRNLVMLSLASAYASGIDAKFVFFACHKGDYTIYSDCRQEFIDCVNNILNVQGISVRVKVPYIEMNKSDIVRIGMQCAVPFSDTWTCYEGGDIPCGKCGSCLERQEAINNNS